MTLYLNDLINECERRGFDGYEPYGETMLVLSVPNVNDLAQTIPVIAEVKDDTLSASAVIAEVTEDFYLPAVRACNELNIQYRYYKHFAQETPDGTWQLCAAADWVARELPAAQALPLLIDFCQHMYVTADRLMREG